MATLKTPDELRQKVSLSIELEKAQIIGKIADALEKGWDGKDQVIVHFDGQLPDAVIRSAVESTLSNKGWSAQWVNNSSYQGACYSIYINDLPKRRGGE